MPKIKDGLYALYLRKSRADLEKEQYGERSPSTRAR